MALSDLTKEELEAQAMLMGTQYDGDCHLFYRYVKAGDARLEAWELIDPDTWASVPFEIAIITARVRSVQRQEIGAKLVTSEVTP